MQDVYITIRQMDQLLPSVAAFEAQFAAQPEEVAILDWGTSYKRQQGYIVVEWDTDEVDPTFVTQLTEDDAVEDFCIYVVPELTRGQLSLLEQAAWAEGEARCNRE